MDGVRAQTRQMRAGKNTGVVAGSKEYLVGEQERCSVCWYESERAKIPGIDTT
jgi:hypothetical protein